MNGVHRRNGSPNTTDARPPWRIGTRLHAGWNRLVGGYAGIADPARHLAQSDAQGWRLVASCALPAVEAFSQAQLEPGVPNCTLVSIVRCLLYLKHHGPAPETERAALYEQVRRVGIRHGYAPDKTGWFHDLFVYSPFVIARMVTESAGAFAAETAADFATAEAAAEFTTEARLPAIRGRSRYVRRFATIRREVDAGRPVLLNLSFGDYPGHTVTITGYCIYRSVRGRKRVFLRTVDGWSDRPSYIDWHRAKRQPSSVTCFCMQPNHTS